MDNLQNIMSSLGRTATSSAPSAREIVPYDEPQEVEPTVIISDDDLGDILRDNGFSEEGENAGTGEAAAPEGEPLNMAAIEEVLSELADEYLNYTPAEEEPEEEDNDEEEEEEEVIDETPPEEEHEEEFFEPVITPNSPTFLVEDSTSRFSGAEWYEEVRKARIILAGIGGIGSHACFQLSRMHPEALFIYDDDFVEEANMSGQLYGTQDIGQSKVDAMGNMIGHYSSVQNVFCMRQRFTPDCEPGNIMMCGFDSMEARKTYFEAWETHLHRIAESSRKDCLFIDGRLSMTKLQVFCLTGDDGYNIERYKREFLFSDEEAEETVCSMKQTTYLAAMIGAVMTNLFINFTANRLDPVIPYSLPFFTQYDAQIMMFNSEN